MSALLKMRPEEVEARNKRLVEHAAREAVDRWAIDPFILPALVDRLQVWAKGDQLVVRSKQMLPRSKSVDEVLRDMQQDPEFAPRFTESALRGTPKEFSEGLTDEEYEVETKRVVAQEMQRVAPEGNVLLLSDDERQRIDREVRAQRPRGAASSRDATDQYQKARVWCLQTNQWIIVERVDAKERVAVGTAAWEQPEG